jgi:predicted ATPase/class 3 adenylate cyclase
MPSGTVTFLFTDIVGSTRLWQQDEAAMREAMARHDWLLRDVVAAYGGVVFSTMGDGVAAAFPTASGAASCAIQAQTLLVEQSRETGGPLKVRMGLHTGEAELRDGDYFGIAVNRGARLAAVGHGGQIICSAATADVADVEVTLVDLGEHRLRDLERPLHVFQIGDGSFPPLRSLNAFPGNLPIHMTSFVGRQDELVAVAKALQSTRLVTVTGAGGVGKTRLAVQAAAQLVTAYPDGVWLCELAAAPDPASMLQVVAGALGYTPAPGVDLQRGVTTFLGSRRALVMLDNCEHLLDPVADLAATILERCANIAILATSREALGVDGERILRLRSLPVPHAAASLDDLAGVDAARLFLDRAEASGAELTLAPEDGPAIAEICRRLDGIPLAIELAAARVIALAPGEIALHLDERFRLLTGGRRAAVERHHTLRAALDWSYSLLSQRDQTVFNHLGVFPASFDASAAQAVVAAGGVEPWGVLDALISLVAKSLLNADRGEGGSTRYQMLESLRHYARERLEAAGGADAARRCHARHYSAAAVRLGTELRGPDEVSWRRRVDADRENLWAALTWSMDAASDEDGEPARVILGELGVGTSGWTVSFFAGTDFDRAVERARRSASRHASLVIASAAVNAYMSGNIRRGRELAREARAGVRDSPHLSGVLVANLMFVDPKDLAAELADDLGLLDELGASAWEYAQLHGAAAGMAAVFGNVELALHESATALEMGRRLGDTFHTAIGLYAFGLASWQSDPVAARAALEEHVPIARATDYDWALARVLALLAQLYAQGGDRPAALAALRESLQNAHLNGDRPALAVRLARGATVLSAAGEYETAAVFCGAVADGVFAGISSYTLPANEIPGHSHFVATLRLRIGDDLYRAATARGAAMTYEQITTLAVATVTNLCSTTTTPY